jgi:hypothetical protein
MLEELMKYIILTTSFVLSMFFLESISPAIYAQIQKPSLANQRLSAPMTFSYHATDPYHRTGRHYILAEGVITSETPYQFQAFFNNLKQGQPPVFFNSPGGNLIAGLKLGRIIRELGLDTFVGGPYRSCFKVDRNGKETSLAPLDKEGDRATELFAREDTCQNCSYSCNYPSLIVDRGICFSACAYAFLGGTGRQIGKTGLYGIHQFKSVLGNSSESNVQVTMTVLANYLDEMGINRKMLDLASVTPSSDIETVSAELAGTLNIDNTTPILSEWQIDVNKAGKIFGYLKQTLSGRDDEIAFFLSKKGKSFIGSVYFIPRNKQWTSQYLNDVFSLSTGLPPEISGERYRVALNVIEGWKAEKNRTYSISFMLDYATLKQMMREETFDFQNNFPNATRHVFNRCAFSTARLDRVIAALLKQN